MDRQGKRVASKVATAMTAARKRTSSASELADARAQQAAVNGILRVMAESPADITDVMNAIAKEAAVLCHAPYARVTVLQGDMLLPLAAYSAEGPQPPALSIPARRTSIQGRALEERRTLHFADVVPLLDDEFPDARENARVMGFRAVLAVPLLYGGEPLGAIFIYRREPGLFASDQVSLVETFAHQAAIALRNVRQSQETREALEQQTATSEILHVISRARDDVQPVFDTIAQSSLTLCQASSSVVVTLDEGLLHIRGLASTTREGAEALRAIFPRPPSRDNGATRAVFNREVIIIPDILEDREYGTTEMALLSGFRSVLAVPLMREGEPIGAISLGRDVPGPFPASQVDLLQTFAAQAVIAIENVRLFTKLGERNAALSESLEQRTATSDILAVISRSPTDVQPVFDTIAENALRLCGGVFSAVYRYDGDLIHVGALRNISVEGDVAFQRAYPCKPNRNGTTQRAILTGRMVHMPDVRLDPEYGYHDVAKAAGFRSVLSMPMLHEGAPIGTITVYREVAGPFPEEKIALLRTFADQAVIAVQNVRLFNEREARNRDLTEALEQQTATSDILRVISQSQTDVQPVFDTIARSVVSLCRAHFANVFTYDGRLIHLAAYVNNEFPEYIDTVRSYYPQPPGRNTAVTRAIATGEVSTIPDVLDDPDYQFPAASAGGGFRSILAVPLMRDGKPVGGIAVGRPEPGDFPESQVALLKIFADQAVIAIENVRLFNELQARNRELGEALEHQVATGDILRVIAQSPTDVQPVFDTIAASALKLCRAASALVTRREGDLVALVASANLTEAGARAMHEAFPMRVGRQSTSARAIVEGRIVVIPDVLTDPDYGVQEQALRAAFRSTLAVPLMRDGQPIGTITVGKPEPGPFSDSLVTLLQTFADQAVIAIENVRLFNELNARTNELSRSVGELRALGEVGQAVSSTLDVETVLGTIVARVTELTGMDAGSIYEYDEERGEFHLHSANGMPADVVDALRASPIRKGEGALGKLATTGEAVEIRDVADERVYQSRVRNALVRIGYRSMLVVPLLRENHLLGGLVVNRKAPGVFEPQVLELMKTFATQSAMAIQNARLYREIEIKSRELEAASRHKSEFLANMSHELRTPLNAIIGFSEVLGERLFGDLNAKQSEYVTDIAESGRHLLELINDILDLSKIEAGRMELDAADVDLPKTIAQTLSLVRERAERRGIRLSSAVDEAIGIVRADARKVKQVLLNLLSNALKFTPEAGRIDVRAAAFDDRVEVSVTDTGIGIALEDQDAVFEEFRQVGASAARVEGTGLGLAISRKFIELHGGRMWLVSAPGKGSTFTFSLPLQPA